MRRWWMTKKTMINKTSMPGDPPLSGPSQIDPQLGYYSGSQTNKVPHKCPVCEGCGQVPAAFYKDGTDAAATECRSCCGEGVIVV